MLLLPEAKKELICWGVSIAIPTIVIPTVYFTTDMYLSNCFVIIGVIYLCFIALWALARQGIFDIFSYQFVNLMSSFRKGAPKKYRDLMQYKEIKTEKRSTRKLLWLPFVSIGSIFVVISIVLAIYKI